MGGIMLTNDSKCLRKHPVCCGRGYHTLNNRADLWINGLRENFMFTSIVYNFDSNLKHPELYDIALESTLQQAFFWQILWRMKLRFEMPRWAKAWGLSTDDAHAEQMHKLTRFIGPDLCCNNRRGDRFLGFPRYLIEKVQIFPIVWNGQQKVSPQAHPTAMIQAQHYTQPRWARTLFNTTPTVPPPITVVLMRMHAHSLSHCPSYTGKLQKPSMAPTNSLKICVKYIYYV